MPKAMVISVGTGRTGQDIANAICFSIHQQNPDYIMFVLTEISKKTLSYILQNPVMKDKEHIEKYLSDENDVEKISLECTEILKEVIKSGYKPQDIVVDYTSGTKAMSAGLTLSAISNKIGTLVYISGKRDKEGRVISGTERAILLKPNIILSEQLFNSSVNLFNKYQYDACVENLKTAKDLFKEDEFQNRCNILIKLANAYSYWDRFELKNAFNELNNLPNSEFYATWGIKSRIEKNKQVLYQEKENKFCPQRMIDPFENARRRGEEGKYDDAVARLYRLLEYIAQYFIAELELYQKKDNEFDTAKLNLEKLPKNIQDKFKGMIGLEKSYELLNNFKHKIGSEIYEQLKNKDSEIRKLLNIRNFSILAHGFNPIDKDKCQKMLSLLEDYLRKYLRKEIDDFEKIADDIKFPKIK